MNKNIIELQTLLERTSSLIRAENRQVLQQHGLLSVQLEALYYLSQCNRYSDTPMAVTEYLGQTKGTVSQTLKVLEKKQLIVKHKDTHDKRIAHIQVTTAGESLVKQLMPSKLMTSIGNTDVSPIITQLSNLLVQLQHQHGSRMFGQCLNCQYNQTIDQTHYHCQLTNEPLLKEETLLICREFTEK